MKFRRFTDTATIGRRAPNTTVQAPHSPSASLPSFPFGKRLRADIQERSSSGGKPRNGYDFAVENEPHRPWGFRRLAAVVESSKGRQQRNVIVLARVG